MSLLAFKSISDTLSQLPSTSSDSEQKPCLKQREKEGVPNGNRVIVLGSQLNLQKRVDLGAT